VSRPVADSDLDVLVTCYAHGDTPRNFPQVRGYYLAKHLARSGLRAEFRQLPQPGLSCEVLICTEYQQDIDWFNTHLGPSLEEIRSERMYCLVDRSLARTPGHFSSAYCDWFAARGGVLCHLSDGALLPHERWIGLGVDADIVRPAADGRRDHVVFDFPRSSSHDPASTFDLRTIDTVRRRLPRHRVIGSGDVDSPVRDAFDAWIDYGQEHGAYVAAVFAGAFAMVPGCAESLGLAVAEAQMAGACIVASKGQVRPEMRVPAAIAEYRQGDADSLADALVAVTTRDGDLIRAQAADRFDFREVVERTRSAVGLA
jgi:hypothetical protein